MLADLAGLPQGAGGCFVSGGSAGNLSALMVGRDTAAFRMGDRAPQRPMFAISEEAHSSVGKALRVLGVEALLVPCDDHRLTGQGLRATLQSHPRGDDVIGIVATGGTTNAGIVDDLAGVGAVARERALWYHVDGAYGCAALFAPSVRGRFDGIELVDSFVVDPHKWLFAPFDCAALVYREPNLAKAVHTQDASYLDVLHTDAPEEWNPSDYAYHLTRRARGPPSLVLAGRQRHRRLPRRHRDGADDHPGGGRPDQPHSPPRAGAPARTLRRAVPTQGWDRGRYESWSARLLEDQIGFVVPTTWEGESVARLALLHPDTTVAMVAEILDDPSTPSTTVMATGPGGVRPERQPAV